MTPRARIASAAGMIPTIDEDARRAAAARLDILTKPKGSLGRLEELAERLAGMGVDGGADLSKRCIVVMAGDHGVVEEGVSAYPAEVTPQMVLNFVRGGAGINVLAECAGADVVVVDMGVAGELPRLPEIRARRIASGTENFARGPAMTRENAERAVATGIEIAEELATEGYTLIGTGDMGIGNTTPSSAICSVIAERRPADVCGRGTGVDDSGLRRKVSAVERGLAINKPDPRDGIDVLAKVGGYEIGGLAGVIIGSAARGIPVVIDGFISGAAALIAATIAPGSKNFMIAAHASVEPGHRVVLSHLGLSPILDLGLRLGEGTGAALAFPIVEASHRILHRMATFEQAGVSEETVAGEGMP